GITAEVQCLSGAAGSGSARHRQPAGAIYKGQRVLSKVLELWDRAADLGLLTPLCYFWDLVQQTQNYLKLLISIINSDDDSGLLVHCISGWDRTPLFISLLRLSLWADGLIHASLEPSEILYLTVAYDWFLFGHMLVDRLSKGEEIFFFCFNFLKHITSEEFSAVKSQRRKSLPPSFTLEEICMLKQRDRGSTTSLSSDFSLGMESSPGAAGSFTYEAVELMPAGAQAQAAWLVSASDRESRLEEVRSAFLASYSRTIGLKAVPPSPSGA
uniref:Myotubularin related protein 14 n=1 Tax=Buteo japonicus TaxID=224669 RepID=A0A8C0AY45_9AVES